MKMIMENWKRFLGMKRKIPAFMPYPRQKHKLGRSKDAPYNEYDGSRGWFDWDAYVEWYKNKQSVQHRGREMPKGGPFGSPSDQQNYEMAQRYGDGIGPPPVFMKDHQKQFLIQEPTDPDETNT